MALQVKIRGTRFTSDIIQRSVSIKKKVVLSDPYEQGERKIPTLGILSVMQLKAIC